jgi:hypothetical protein
MCQISGRGLSKVVKELSIVQIVNSLTLTDGGMKRWGLRATFLSSYTELDAGQNARITT